MINVAIKKHFSKRTLSTNIRGFTLIELLAVIIILGILLIIAIPSVTEYIQSSRKNAYIVTASEYINGARTKINSAEIKAYDTEATYYLPARCISLEKGGKSPFGKLEEAYVVVTYDGKVYDYYWTSRDESNMGILLTSENLLSIDRVESGITSIDTEIGIVDKEKILMINDCNSDNLTEKIAKVTIAEDSLLEEDKILAKNLYYVISSQNLENGVRVLDNEVSSYVSARTGINFNLKPSETNGKGVYIRSGTENDMYPVYYYRGSITNNNVIFGGFCWKMVRTTETGGVKLIYNGVPTDGTCNNTGTSSQIGTSPFNSSANYNAYIGYMYGTPNSSTYEEEHANINDSTIKVAIDTWYSKNMTEYTSYLEDTIWCNDRSFASSNTGTGAGTSVTHYGAYGRDRSNPTPSLECIKQNDRFTVNENMEGRVVGNGLLTYPVALLTADELTLAGQGYNGYSSTNYLHTTKAWWSLSPDYFNAISTREFRVGASGNLDGNYLNNEYGVRPSVSLKFGTKITNSGDGSIENPFVVQ